MPLMILIHKFHVSRQHVSLIRIRYILLIQPVFYFLIWGLWTILYSVFPSLTAYRGFPTSSIICKALKNFLLVKVCRCRLKADGEKCRHQFHQILCISVSNFMELYLSEQPSLFNFCVVLWAHDVSVSGTVSSSSSLYLPDFLNCVALLFVRVLCTYKWGLLIFLQKPTNEKLQDVQLYRFIYYIDMFRSLLWPSSGCRPVMIQAIHKWLHKMLETNLPRFVSTLLVTTLSWNIIKSIKIPSLKHGKIGPFY
jgi:ABC-type sugar transport system permease subunit